MGESGEWRTYSAPIELQQDGTIEVYYRSVDKAGNLEPEKHATVKIDKTAPMSFSIGMRYNKVAEHIKLIYGGVLWKII